MPFIQLSLLSDHLCFRSATGHNWYWTLREAMVLLICSTPGRIIASFSHIINIHDYNYICSCLISHWLCICRSRESSSVPDICRGCRRQCNLQCFVAIYAFLLKKPFFFCDYRTFYVKKDFSQNACLWRKEGKYKVWVQGAFVDNCGFQFVFQ